MGTKKNQKSRQDAGATRDTQRRPRVILSEAKNLNC
jgi:hypothetical protein